MKAIFQSTYNKYFLAALLINVITAWFSVGSHHPDEHYQILEFANYKLGNTPGEALPWEFNAQMRPALQPFVVFCFLKCFFLIGINNPFFCAFLLRLVMGIFIWFISCKLILLLTADFKNEGSKKIFILLSFFLWFMPYLSVRFSSENAASLCLLVSAYLLLRPYDSHLKKNISYFLIGSILALSFFFRFQIAFALIGFAIWILFVKKVNYKNIITAAISFLLTCFVCVLIDKWFYGNWVFTPYNYYVENIIKHAAANFGVEPFWYYFLAFFNLAIPPLSLILIYFFVVGLIKNSKHVFSFILLAFIIGHSLVAHKEIRFLYPVAFEFIYLVALGIDLYFNKIKSVKAFRISFVLIIIINSFILLYRVFAPAQEAILYYQYIYNSTKKKTTVVSLGESMYQYMDKIFFYRSENVNEIVLKEKSDLNKYLNDSKSDTIIVFKKNISEDFPSNFRSERIYCIYPSWLLKHNINDWQSRANIWCVYQLTKKH